MSSKHRSGSWKRKNKARKEEYVSKLAKISDYLTTPPSPLSSNLSHDNGPTTEADISGAGELTYTQKQTEPIGESYKQFSLKLKYFLYNHLALAMLKVHKKLG